ncbi:MAG: hypothetical protein GX090_04265 [Firmicutes bacterium]|nr:hypothetical protein [Bacillota bacterium]HOB34208.1 hypothetical protein [Bacillota bacterium]HPZ90202.1 hypothetical protein [Bacillota bacterium]HQE01592.1 hypothetical protein [Bacillota bacterium]
MPFAAEYVTLAGKAVGGIQIHPVVEIRVWAGRAGAMAEAAPVALVVHARGQILTFLMNPLKTSNDTRAGDVV